MEGLQDKRRCGRWRKADEAYLEVLAEALEREPAEYGYGFAIWTVDRLRAHVEGKTGKSLSRERFRVLMKDMGYVYRRPKRDMSHLQNKSAHAQAAALMKELKKGQGMARLSSSLWTKAP